MEKIDFIAGNEKRFAQFISELNDKDKIALISHTDLDGIVAAKVVDYSVKPDIIKFLGYEDINKNLIQYLKEKDIKFVIITDLFIKNSDLIKEIEKFSRILIIDHHLFNVDLNSEKTVFINSQGYCAAYICYYLFSNLNNLEKIDWLVACACVADWQYRSNTEWIREIYGKYGDNFISSIEGVKKSNKFWKLQLDIAYALIYFNEDLKRVYDSIGNSFGDIGDLGKYSDIIEGEIENAVNKFEKEKIDIEDGYFWEFKPNYSIGSIVSTTISEKYQNKTIIIARKNEDVYNFSARRQDGKMDMNDLLKNLASGLENSSGGGHFKAAGGFVQNKDIQEFKRRLGLRVNASIS